MAGVLLVVVALSRGGKEEEEKAAEEALDEIEDIEFEEIPPMRLEQK